MSRNGALLGPDRPWRDKGLRGFIDGPNHEILESASSSRLTPPALSPLRPQGPSERRGAGPRPGWSAPDRQESPVLARKNHVRVT
jgi:hypothetical protein